jgi:threonine/homoserine/homoserine lactone efflux protein
MSLETWLLFSGAALVVILIPGPLSLLMISNSLNYGLRRSYPAFLGGVIASICLLSASALGLGALLLASEQLFSALKIVGALYLFYLAWQSWQQSRQPSVGAEVPQAAPVPRFRALFGRAFVLGASNPKDILFFAAFLPQLLMMIATWTVLDLLCKLAYGLGAHGAARYLRSGKGQSWFNRVSAGLFSGAGAASLLSNH